MDETRYKFIDELTSDVIFEAYGREKRDLLTNAAHALFDVICKQSEIKPEKELKIEVDGTNSEDLLFNWLQSLIAQVDIEEMFFSKFTIVELTDTKLTAFIYGESITPKKGETVVKAVTYHQFKLEKTASGWMCRVSLDI